jgi:hypothetical protein
MKKGISPKSPGKGKSPETTRTQNQNKKTTMPKPESNWSNNNRAHLATAADLNYLEEIDAAFPEAGAIKTTEFRFWNKSQSPEGRAIEAMNLAAELVKIATGPHFATYEPGRGYAGTVEAIKKALTDADNTVCDVANVADECLRYYNEGKA